MAPCVHGVMALEASIDMPQSWQKNRILAALPEADFARLMPYLEPSPLHAKAVLFDVGESFTQLYFPHSGVVSLVTVMEDGTTAETAMVGREGMVGLSALVSDSGLTSRHTVQIPGVASCIDFSRFRRIMRESAALRPVLSAYAQALFSQVLQSVACNSLHGLRQRCSRWLLMAHDRGPGDTFPLTHEAMAEMLGVRRASVTLVARTLQKAGLIHYRHGILTVLDRRGLEAASCECYRTVRRIFERLLPLTFA